MNIVRACEIINEDFYSNSNMLRGGRGNKLLWRLSSFQRKEPCVEYLNEEMGS